MADEKIQILIDLAVSKEVDRRFKALSSKAGVAGQVSGDKFATGFKKGVSRVDVFTAALGARAAAFAINTIRKSVSEAVTVFRDFSRGIAEINSILPANEKLTKASTQAIINFSSQFASGPAEQARAFYNIVSAGVKGTATQLKTLEAANTAAVAGIVDIDRAAKVLVSSVNSYSKSGLTATQASDALFSAVREGQTTFGELADTIGVVAPLASSAGLKFTELTGSLAAITKAGVRTDQAVTGVRAVLTSILKPSEEAAKEAKRLGIELTATGLKAKGFVGFIRDISVRTKNSAESIAKLFGNVRALTPILQLANSETKNFDDILKKTAKSAGDTGRAFKIISENIDFKLKKRSQEISNFGLLIARTAKETFGSVVSEVIPSINAIQSGFITFSKIVNNFVIAPLELIFNAFKVVFNSINTLVAGAVNLIAGQFGKFGKIIEDSFGINTLSEKLKTFAESASDVFKQNSEGLGASVDEIFDGSVFGKGEAFIANLENNLAAAKSSIEESGITPPGAPSPDASGPGIETGQFDTLTTKIKGVSAAIKTLGNDFKVTSKDISKSLVQGLGNGAGQAFAAFGAALVKGENALKAFGKAFLAAIGQQMVTLGTRFILEGIAVSFSPTMGGPAVGGPLIGAGAALAAAGGALSAAVSGGAGASAGGGVGALSSGGGDIEESPLVTQTEPAEPETRVAVTIQGDVFDSEESGLRIAQILESASLNQNVSVVGAV